VLITNGNLELVDAGIEYIIKTDKKHLDGLGSISLLDESQPDTLRRNRMDEWCTNQHGKVRDASRPPNLYPKKYFNQSGLTKACLESSYTLEFVSKTVLDYIKKWIPESRVGVLAGSSVHADRMFLAAEMPDIVNYLHYR